MERIAEGSVTKPRSDESVVEAALRSVYHRVVPERDRSVLLNYRKLLGTGWPTAIVHSMKWRFGDSTVLARTSYRRLAVPDTCWCFVLGVNNSGTTLLDRILQTHPEVRGLPTEGQWLTAALPRPPDFGVSRMWTDEEEVFRWREDHDERAALRCIYDWAPYYSTQTGHILLEKSPPNSVRSRWLQQNFRPARFIAMVRSAYAVSEGVRRRTGVSIAAAAHHWTRANQILLEDVAYLDQVFTLKYESFCESPGVHLEELRSFLDLRTPFPDDATEGLEVHNIHDAVGGVRSFNAESLDRLSPEEIRTINQIAGEVMDKLGYERLG